ncbi:MAG: AAA family ATPase [Acidimicrobiales bacterium]|nr:AAA family ATPase [Acidimicrobiales bacterium]
MATGSPPADALSAGEYARIAAAIEAEIGKVIVGQTDLVRVVLTAMLCEGHVLLEGVPGLGKTQLLKTLSDIVDLEFSRIQFTPDLMPADVLGTQVLHEGDAGHREFQFRPGPVFGNLVLADEVNRATPKTQSAMLEAMQERAVTVAGETRPLPRPFLVMATQNPLEMEGTYLLPEAQLDRFMLKALVPFPPAEDLVAIVERTTGTTEVDLSVQADGATLTRMIALTRQVPVADHLVRHAVDLVAGTHPTHETAPEPVRKYVRFGASPRGAQAIILAAKATALINGRPNVSMSDIRAMAVPALRHRMVLGYEATADGMSADAIVAALLTAIPEPDAGLRGSP